MSIYEDDNFINQLADEDAAEDQRRKQTIEHTLRAISELEGINLKFVLRMMMIIITKTY